METKETKTEIVTPVAPVVEASKPKEVRKFGGDLKKNSRRPSPRREQKARPEFDQRIIDIRRVARVVAGGRRFSFSVALVAGDKKGRVGVGLAKATDTSLAIDKALRQAKKNMIQVGMTKTMSIPHDVYVKYSSARILLTPAPDRGIVAGSSVRTILELAGLKDVNAKILSPSKNKLNNARATIIALGMLRKPR
jgi:small subunit ribosomal protein S5